MKSKIFNCVLSGLALLAAGLVTSASGAAMPGVIEGQAVVMVVTGNATATDGAGAPAQLRNGQILKAGTTVNTQPGSTVVLDLGDNGNALEIKPDSTLKIDTLLKKQVGQEKTITTELDLKKGSVVGNVKKLSKASTYDVKTANGVAGIRGTSFHIFAVGIFRCANGLLIVRVTDLSKPPGDASRTVSVTVPAGREVVVPPQAAPTPNAPAPAPRVTLRPVLIERDLVVLMVNEANVIGVIVNLPVTTPPGTPVVAPEQRQQINRAITDAVNAILSAGANQTQLSDLTDAQRVAAFLVNKCGATSALDPLVTTANAAYSRAFTAGYAAPVAAAIAIAICQTQATSLTDSLFNSAVKAEVGFVTLTTLPKDLNTIPVSPIIPR